MDIATIAVNGIPVLVIIIGLVEAAKRLGIEGKGSLILALVLGLVFSLLIQLSVIYPAVSPWVTAVVIGLALGLAATGIYDLGMRYTNRA